MTEQEALNTPIKDLTPDGLRMAVVARDKKDRETAKANASFVPSVGKIYVMEDIKAFKSPVTGKVIDGRYALKEHLKETGCRIVDPSEARDHGIKERQE